MLYILQGCDMGTSISQRRTQGLLSSSESHATGSNKAKGSSSSSLDDFFLPGQPYPAHTSARAAGGLDLTPSNKNKQLSNKEEEESKAKLANQKECDNRGCHDNVERGGASGHDTGGHAVGGVVREGAASGKGNEGMCRDEQQISEEAKLLEKVKEADMWSQIR